MLPNYLQREGSSLVYMADRLIAACGSGGFYLDDYEKLLADMARDPKPKILLGVSYALWDLAERYAPKFENTVVMETGGMKGHREELPKARFHRILCEAFGVESIHSEYGMAELLSLIHIYLASICRQVYLIVRKPYLRASKAMQERVMNTPNIKVLFEHNTAEVLGDETGVTGALLRDNKGTETKIDIAGFFVAIGHHPNTEIFADQLELDAEGYILSLIHILLMMFSLRSREAVKEGRNQLFVDRNIFPQTLDVLITRSEPFGIELVIDDYNTYEFTGKEFGAIVQYLSLIHIFLKILCLINFPTAISASPIPRTVSYTHLGSRYRPRDRE